MFATEEVNELTIRKQQLLAASRINRRLLTLQVEQFQTATAWVDWGYRLAQSLRPALKIGLPIAGLLLFRKRDSSKSLLLRVLGGWQLAMKVLGIWRSLRSTAE